MVLVVVALLTATTACATGEANPVGAGVTTSTSTTVTPTSTTLPATMVSSTIPPVGSVPPELAGAWQGEHPSGDTINLHLRGTRWSLNAQGGIGVGGDLMVEGDTIIFVGVYECPGNFEYTWSIEGDRLRLTPRGDDPCPRGGLIQGVDFTLVSR